MYRIKSLAKSIFVSIFCPPSTCVFTTSMLQWNYPDNKDTWVSGEAQSKQTNKTNFLEMQNVTNLAIRSNMLRKLYDLCYRMIVMMLFRFFKLLKKMIPRKTIYRKVLTQMQGINTWFNFKHLIKYKKTN